MFCVRCGAKIAAEFKIPICRNCTSEAVTQYIGSNTTANEKSEDNVDILAVPLTDSPTTSQDTPSPPQATTNEATDYATITIVSLVMLFILIMTIYFSMD